MENIYEDFFSKAKKLKEKMELKKLRGLNDFNIFTTLLSSHDEVRVHSRFIHSLLNIKGEHYQKELFLELFIKSCGLEDFGLDVKNTVAYTEYAHIDIYLTDGNRHIIIENKIYAGDQKHQIKRYIEEIAKENKEIKGDEVYVIYLSLDRDKPSGYSLENFVLHDNFLTYKNSGKLANLGEIRFKSIHYKKEIKSWINSCLHEVSNLTNLHVIITQYKNTIDLLYGKYKGVEMELEKIMEENYEMSREIYAKFENVKDKIIYDFYETVRIDLSKILENKWVIKNAYKIISIRIDENNNNEIYFKLKFNKGDENPFIGICCKEASFDSYYIYEKIKEKNPDLNVDEWRVDDENYLHWIWLLDKVKYLNNDFVLNIANKSEEQKDKLKNDLVKALYDFFIEFEPIVSKINKNIEDYLK